MFLDPTSIVEIHNRNAHNDEAAIGEILASRYTAWMLPNSSPAPPYMALLEEMVRRKMLTRREGKHEILFERPKPPASTGAACDNKITVSGDHQPKGISHEHHHGRGVRNVGTHQAS